MRASRNSLATSSSVAQVCVVPVTVLLKENESLRVAKACLSVSLSVPAMPVWAAVECGQ
jgi:hypothetical protein